MNIVKRVLAALERPEQKLAALKPELLKLAEDLAMVEEEASKEPLQAIVTFFQVTSPWHDRGLADVIDAFKRVNDGKYDAIIGALVTLDGQFELAGRSDFGWNRTKRGEAVTPDQVFLGNIYGLFTLPVPRWLKGKDEPKDSWTGVVNKNPYDVVSAQALDFIKNHAPVMATRARALAA